MKKINALIFLIATLGVASFTGYAGTNYEFAPGLGFHYGAGFGSFGNRMGMIPASYASVDFGPFSHFSSFGGGFGYYGGFGSGMTTAMTGFGPGAFVYMDGFGGFGGADFGNRAMDHNTRHKIVPIPPFASATSGSISFDESGEILVRPFDDEDLFVED